MRFVVVIAVAALVSLPPAFAANTDKVPDQEELSALEAKAEQATPREQCYLYAKVVKDMADLTGKQLDAGDSSAAYASLKDIQKYTAKVGMGITQRSKKLKDAQIIMRRTAFRLQELMRDASYGEQAGFQSTLKELNAVQSQMMLAVFKK